MFVVIAYDIRDNRRRVKIEKVLSSRGVRINYSIFELIVNKRELKTLTKELKKESKKEDSIRVYLMDFSSVKSSYELNDFANPFEFESGYV